MGKQSNNNNNNNSNDKNMSGANVGELKKVFESVVAQVEERIKVLDEKEAHWSEMVKQMETHSETASQKIVLDIGGQRFATSKTTLLAAEGSFFHAMLASGKWKPDADGTYFIDRNPELFPVILDYLRMGKFSLKKYGYDVMDDLRAELDFFQITIPDEVLFNIKEFANSKILSGKQKEKLLEWLNNRRATLLYSATRDGFSASAFHRLCDNKGKTITVIRSTQGYIFGGYADNSWDSSNSYKNVYNCWLFTLTNPNNLAPTKFVAASTSSAMYCATTLGPTFGEGHDISLSDNSNNNNSYIGFPSTYSDSVGHGNKTFTGARNFQTNEVEVFLVQ